MDILENEVFRVINFDGLDDYTISNKGRVSRNGKIRKTNLNRYGYEMIVFTINGKSKTMSIHKLVALTFMKEGEKEFIEHIDGNRSNNALENLLWKDTRNEKYQSTKKANEKIKEIRSKKIKVLKDGVVSVYPSTQEASRQTGISSIRFSELARGVKREFQGYEAEYI